MSALSSDQIAAELIARGFAYRLPLSKTRCLTTIELGAIPDSWGRLYVKPSGEIRYGYTLRESHQVSDRFRVNLIGDPTDG